MCFKAKFSQKKLNSIISSILLFASIIFTACNTQEHPLLKEYTEVNKDTCTIILHCSDTPNQVKLLIKYYDKVVGYKDNKIIFSDSSTLIYDDGIHNKTIGQVLNNPDIQDQFQFNYSKGKLINPIPKDYDPGRIRNEAFFKKIYGTNAQEVKKNLVEIIWCPALVNQKILVTNINGVAEKVKMISAELDKLPQYKKYIQNIGGTFNWRNIKGTNRLSMHSFGMTIDINTKYSNYWQWDCKCTDENRDLIYKNQIPQEIIDIFERYGFVWGGKWYHYDTMHFEYRPELLD